MTDNGDVEFLISCLLHADGATDLGAVAEDNGIVGTAALKASTLASVFAVARSILLHKRLTSILQQATQVQEDRRSLWQVQA